MTRAKAMRIVLTTFLALACAIAQAKGIFQAQGTIAEVSRSGDTITFRFKGWISAGYATAPDDDPKRRWHDMGWQSVDVPVTLREWTRLHQPGETDPAPDIAAVLARLQDLAQPGRRVGFSIDNPAFFLTNRGQLARVQGTYIHIGDLAGPSSRH